MCSTCSVIQAKEGCICTLTPLQQCPLSVLCGLLPPAVSLWQSAFCLPCLSPAPGRYTEAAEKYARARDNLADMTHADAVQLRRACVLNLSSCYLNSSKYEACVQCCQEVLAGEANANTAAAAWCRVLALTNSASVH